MKRVQTVTQKHYRVKNPGQKPNWLHEPPTGPASTLGAPRRARASVSWLAQRRIVVGLPGRIAASGCRVLAPQRRIAGIVPLAPARCDARRAARLAPRVSQAQRPYRGRVLCAPTPCRGCCCALCRKTPQQPGP